MALVRLAERVLVSGQLLPDDAPALLDAGVSAVVNHRPDDEEPGQPSAEEVAAAFEAVGISVSHAPVRGYPSADAVRLTADVLDHAEGKVVLFCRSGMRSTVTWALGRREAGDEADDLRAAAANAGYDLSSVPL